MTLKIIILIQIKVHLYYTLKVSPVRWWKSLPTLQNCTCNRNYFGDFLSFLLPNLSHPFYLLSFWEEISCAFAFIARFDTGLTPMAQTSGMTHHRGLINRWPVCYPRRLRLADEILPRSWYPSGQIGSEGTDPSRRTPARSRPGRGPCCGRLSRRTSTATPGPTSWVRYPRRAPRGRRSPRGIRSPVSARAGCFRDRCYRFAWMEWNTCSWLCDRTWHGWKQRGRTCPHPWGQDWPRGRAVTSGSKRYWQCWMPPKM